MGWPINPNNFNATTHIKHIFDSFLKFLILPRLMGGSLGGVPAIAAMPCLAHSQAHLVDHWVIQEGGFNGPLV